MYSLSPFTILGLTDSLTLGQDGASYDQCWRVAALGLRMADRKRSRFGIGSSAVDLSTSVCPITVHYINTSWVDQFPKK